MTPSVSASLQKLGRDYPDWKPWLPVIEEVLTEAARSEWVSFVPARSNENPNRPLLVGATIALDLRLVRDWFVRLIRIARENGTPAMATLRVFETSDLDLLSLFRYSLCQDIEPITQAAVNLKADSDAFRAVADLLPVPFLRACARQWNVTLSGWMQGYCGVCGSWPVFAEVRGIERNRHLRCGRCASGWETRWLWCPYCGTAEHEQLVSLVPETGTTTRTVEGCKRCFGYLKSFAVLQGASADGVMLQDFESVDLDIAAVQQNFKRPAGPGYKVDVTVIEQPATKRSIFPWIR